MRRRLINVCLLAYPRATRQRDGGHLRDLALELAEAQGARRQVVSLLIGGVRERAARRRRWSALSPALAVAALAIVAWPGASAGQQEVERFACETSRQSGDCDTGARQRHAYERAGWRCSTDAARASEAGWRCVR